MMDKQEKILIYCDYGCSNVANLEKMLNQYFPDASVGYTDSARIIQGELNRDVKAFFMPGGAATPYRKKLAVLGNEQIKKYVENGGFYFGVCAGAYYACSRVEFEADVPELSIEQTEGLLGLIEADAVGTLYKEFGLSPYSLNASSAKVVGLRWLEDNSVDYSLYHGGPYFCGKNKDSFEVLATYSDIKNELPAIVMKKFGQGKVLLSGVHFEDKGDDLKKCIHSMSVDKEIAQKNAQDLLCKESQREILAGKLMGFIKSHKR